MKVLVTGTAGFIGNHVALALLERGDSVVGLDNLNPYYDVTLKEARLKRLTGSSNFVEARIDLEDRVRVEDLFSTHKPVRVIHLAAQAGVRHSLETPHAYTDSNITGFLNILEQCRNLDIEHLVYASSSSVYGGNSDMPFSTGQHTDQPLSLYGATKKANELMAHAYSHLFDIPATGLRFFTVYGPWGRPDMALFMFTKAILENRPIDVFNEGRMSRDFTYIDDVVEGVVRILGQVPGDSGLARHRVFNIGNGSPVELTRFIEILEAKLWRSAEKNMLPMQAGDVPATFADVGDLAAAVGFRPTTTVEEGVAAFVDWYLDYYGATN